MLSQYVLNTPQCLILIISATPICSRYFVGVCKNASFTSPIAWHNDIGVDIAGYDIGDKEIATRNLMDMMTCSSEEKYISIPIHIYNRIDLPLLYNNSAKTFLETQLIFLRFTQTIDCSP